jgi:hypothetical protein
MHHTVPVVSNLGVIILLYMGLHSYYIGAIYSIVSLFACVAPTTTFQLYGIIPVPAWLLVTGLFSYDLYSTLSNKVRNH